MYALFFKGNLEPCLRFPGDLNVGSNFRKYLGLGLFGACEVALARLADSISQNVFNECIISSTAKIE